MYTHMINSDYVLAEHKHRVAAAANRAAMFRDFEPTTRRRRLPRLGLRRVRRDHNASVRL